MDPLSIAASITAVIGATNLLISYLSDVKDASKGRLALIDEAQNWLKLFSNLSNRAKEAEKNHDLRWYDGIRKLGGEKGPLELFKKALEVLATRLKPSSSAIKGAARSLLWTFDRTEVANTLDTMGRITSHINMVLAGDQFELSRHLQDNLAALEENVRQLAVDSRESKIETSCEHQRKIVEWLSPLDFLTTQKENFQQREPGTGTWLLDSPGFHDWRNGSGKVLWCSGIPGAGKTVLASVVMNHLQTTTARERVAALCIYFNHKEAASQTAVHLLSSLLRQVVERCSDVSKAVTDFRRVHNTTGPTFDQVKSAFVTEIEPYEKIFVIIDALDECASEKIQRVLLEALKSPGINIMVTTRYSVKAENFFSHVGYLDIRAKDSDVQKYIESRIADESRLTRQVERALGLREDIVQKVTKSSKGMFLAARLHMDSLAGKSKVRDVRAMLKCLPETLQNTYKEAVKRIRTQCLDDSNLAERVIYWVTYSIRPLLLQEIRCALAIEPGMTELGEDDLDDEESLISVCAGLVVVDDKSSLVRLVHFTAQDYFKKTHKFEMPNGLIGTACLTYLLTDIFGGGSKDDLPMPVWRQELWEAPTARYRHSTKRGDEESRTFAYTPFSRYAFEHWHDHIRGEVDEKVLNLAIGLLSNKSKLEALSYVSKHSINTGMEAIHLAASLNLENILNILLEQQLDIDVKDDGGYTPLHWAVWKGHDNIARLLIGKGADLNIKDNQGETPFNFVRGHTAMADTLIASGADLNARDKLGRSPLYTAIWGGCETIAKLLIAKGADLDSELAENGQQLLSTIIRECPMNARYKDVLKLLVIEKKMNVNFSDMMGDTPLGLAARRGYEDTVKILIEECGATLDRRDERGRTPLALALAGGHGSIAELLIEKGAELNTEDNEHRTPLMWARALAKHVQVPGYDWEKILTLMIDKGADPKVEDVLGIIRKLNDRELEERWAKMGAMIAGFKALTKARDLRLNDAAT